MKFLKFINSNAVRNHLKDINYEFAPVEAAYVVWQSEYCPMDEKHEAWKHIIDNYADENVIDSVTEIYKSSLQECYGNEFGLHEYLQCYIDKEKRLAKLAMTDEVNTVFSFETYYDGDCDTCEDKRLFTKVKNLMAAIDEEISNMHEYSLKWIFIKKRWLDMEEKYVELKLKPDKSFFSIVGNRNISNKCELHMEDFFYSMWFKIPTPFRKGDVLYRNVERFYRYIGKEVPFVLDNICYWDIDDAKETRTRHAWGSMDMLAEGYFVTPEGQLYRDNIHSYLDLEYYDDEPTGIHRTLKAMSSYMKNEIDMGLMMNAYSIVLNEERIKNQRELLGMTNRGLELAGLKVDSLVEKIFPDCVHKYPDGLYTIAGRPAMGKSLVANVIALEMVNLYDKKVKYIQCEKIINEAVLRKNKAEYDFLYDVGISVDKIEKELKNPDIDVLMIDNYNFMDRKKIDCAAELKRLSSKYRKIIFALSSVSRKADSRKNKRPVKADMTKQMCDSLWNSSDAVIFLYRDTYYDQTSENTDLELIVVKGSSTYGRYKYDFNKLLRRNL